MKDLKKFHEIAAKHFEKAVDFRDVWRGVPRGCGGRQRGRENP
jgi:hypothetical protein